jgi:serine protease Do
MEENNQETRDTESSTQETNHNIQETGDTSPEVAAYTGEYGNAVESINHTPQSDGTQSGTDTGSHDGVYSYSYRERQSEATHSGDYSAREHDRSFAGGTTSSASSESSDSHGWYQAPPQQETYRESSGNDTGSSFYGGSRETAAEPADGKKKKSGGFPWKKIAGCVGLAVIFGAVAAACFQGVCYFSSNVLGVNLTAASKNIPYTTDQVNYTVAATDTAIGTADVSGIAQETMPSIVSITSTTQGEGTYDLFGQYYEGEDTTSAGTGFIVGKNDSELLIATNNHVVSDAKAISVQFFDDEVYDATTKGNDSSADLAVIAVKLKDMKDSTLDSIRIATLGDSSECKVGEMVVAIGNALGYGQSVTVGYVSAKDREITEESDDSSSSSSQGSTIKVIQTDAAINPGNSGGPLINMQGEVIGINSAKIAASSVEGVGYSIPISEATPIIDELMNREVLTDSQKGYLGISGKTVTQEASNFNVPEGVYVAEVAEGGAADKAGIKMGDIITAINDIQVTTIESLKEKANSYKKGTKITITLQRSDNGTYKEKNVEVTLQGESSLNKLEDSSGSTNSDSSNDNSGQGNGGSGQDGSNGNSGSNGDSGSGQDGSGDDSQDGGSSFGNWGSLFPFGN